MSVLIKGMGMPKNCFNCSTKIDPENRRCDIDRHIFEETLGKLTTRRDDDCPLVEVPTPHGPLIDADEIIEVQMLDEMYEEWTLKTMSVAEYLAFAADTPPTIIEAEEGAEV